MLTTIKLPYQLLIRRISAMNSMNTYMIQKILHSPVLPKRCRLNLVGDALGISEMGSWKQLFRLD